VNELLSFIKAESWRKNVRWVYNCNGKTKKATAE